MDVPNLKNMLDQTLYLLLSEFFFIIIVISLKQTLQIKQVFTFLLRFLLVSSRMSSCTKSTRMMILGQHKVQQYLLLLILIIKRTSSCTIYLSLKIRKLVKHKLHLHSLKSKIRTVFLKYHNVVHSSMR